MLRLSQFKEASDLIKYHQKSIEKGERQLQDEEKVTFCHWITNIHLKKAELAILSKETIT